MKKVLLFQDYFYYGGIEKVILDIKNNLNNNYNIEILSFCNKSEKKVINLLKKEYKNFTIRNILGLYKLKKYIKNKQYDIIHINCYNSFGLVYAALLKKQTKKIIIHGHNNSIDNDFFKIKTIINTIIKLLFLNDYYTYISSNESVRKFCFNNKGIIISNGIDYNLYKVNNKKRKEYRNKYNIDNKKVIGYIARFEKQKNHLFLINLFSKLLKLNTNYYLVLIGEGRELKRIKKEVLLRNIEEKVLFLNYRQDIPNLINMFDYYISPSLYEGFGLTLVENQINNKIVFISNTIDDKIIISNNTYKMNLNDDIEKIAKRINNTKLKKQMLNSKYELNKFIDKIKTIYE